jgi:hypothetical protein
MLRGFHHKENLVNCIDQDLALLVDTDEHPTLLIRRLIALLVIPPVAELDISHRYSLVMILDYFY